MTERKRTPKHLNTMVPPSERTMGVGDLIWLWLGMTAQMGIFLLGASFAERISFTHAMLAMVIGNLIIAVVLILNGDVGTKYGLKFSTYLTAPFGRLGKMIPGLMRALTGVFWFGIQTYYGALAIDISIEFLTGYSNWILWYILFAIVQVIITIGGISAIKWLENSAAPLLIVLSVWLIYKLVQGHSFGEFLYAELTDRLNFWSVVTANLSYWITVAVNISDFTRHVKVDHPEGGLLQRNKTNILGQLPGITIGMLLFISVGMIGKFYSGYGNPVEMVSHTLGGYYMFIGLGIILLAQLSTNVAANLYAPGNILSDLFKNIDYGKAIIISGVAGALTFPWLLLDHFLVYLPIIGAFLSPLPGILIVDYFFIRKTKIDVQHFKTDTGKYEYSKGFNPAAMITYVIAGVLGIIFLDYSWLVSLPVAVIIYYILMTKWVLPKYPESQY